MPPLKPCATMPVPPPTLPSGTAPPRGPRQRFEGMRLGDVLALAVVQERIRRLAHHRLVPWDGRLQHLVEVAVHGVADHADRVGAGDHHRAAEHAAFNDPRRAGHLAEAVAGKPAGEHRRPLSATRPHRRHARAHGSLAHHERAVTAHHRRVTHFHAGHVSDCVQRTGRAVERHAERAGPRLGLRTRRRYRQQYADPDKGPAPVGTKSAQETCHSGQADYSPPPTNLSASSANSTLKVVSEP